MIGRASRLSSIAETGASLGRGVAVMLVFLIGLALTPGPLLAQGFAAPPPSFSAQVVRTMPGAQPVTGQLYVGDQGIRSEVVRDKQRVWMIFRHDQKTVYALYPDSKQYESFPANDVGRPPLPEEEGSLCLTDAKVSCKVMRREVVNGRVAHLWEVRVTRTEKPEVTYLWIDPQLRFAIKEQYHDGAVLELRNIRVGALPTTLFDLPGDFVKFVPAANDAKGAGQ